jgi:hypothetical protein
MTQSNSCALPHAGDILNADHSEWPLLQGTLYGTVNETAKLAKRIKCGLGTTPIRLRLTFETDALKAAEAGVAKDPTLQINGKNIIEGLVQTETIPQYFSSFIH